MNDLIGDIHGHAAELIQVLDLLGYGRRRGHYRHPQRQAVFVGDFVEGGPQIRKVLQVVRPMVENAFSKREGPRGSGVCRWQSSHLTPFPARSLA